MNKKVILGLLGGVAVIFLISAGVTIDQQRNNYSPEARVLKTVKLGNEKAYKTVSTKGYDASFKQAYTIEYKDYSKKYTSEGSAAISIYMDEPTEEKLTPAFMINGGKGYLKGEQKESSTINGQTSETTFNFAFKADPREIFLTTNLNGKEFNARMDKFEFTETVSDEKLTEDVWKLLYLDAWDDIKTVTKATYELLSSIDTKNAAVINDLVKKHEITVDRDEIGYVIKFNLDTKDLLGVEAKISGEMLIDKDNYNVPDFKYDLRDYLTKKLEAAKGDKQDFKVDVTEYEVNGQSIAQTLGEEIIINDPILRFHKETITDFSNKFSENIVQKQ